MENNKKSPTLRQKIYFLLIYTLFEVFYRDEEKGYFIKKRLWLFILLTPIIVPFFMISGILQYFSWIRTYNMAWIEHKKEKLSFKEKLFIIDSLI